MTRLPNKLLTAGKELYTNLRGFHTKRHIVVIESDDWGAIRMPSRETFLKLKENGDHPEKDAFLSNDSLESAEDLLALSDVLSSFRDSVGAPPVITMNYVLANPDFDRMGEHPTAYYYEPFYQTYLRYGGQNTLSTLKQGIGNHVFFPQLHCREHLNVHRWLADIAAEKEDAVCAYRNRMIGIGSSFCSENQYGYMDSFNYDSDEELDFIRTSVKEAAELFENTFGFRSKTIACPCFTWDKKVEAFLAENGIIGIQSGFWQNDYTAGSGTEINRRVLHFTGEKSIFSCSVSVRNCEFEPAYLQNPKEQVALCLEQIRRSFSAGKPAIINSHRLNYIGSVSEKNRTENLKGLSSLLTEMLSLYPDTEFFTSEQLHALLQNQFLRDNNEQ